MQGFQAAGGPAPEGMTPPAAPDADAPPSPEKLALLEGTIKQGMDMLYEKEFMTMATEMFGSTADPVGPLSQITGILGKHLFDQLQTTGQSMEPEMMFVVGEGLMGAVADFADELGVNIEQEDIEDAMLVATADFHKHLGATGAIDMEAENKFISDSLANGDPAELDRLAGKFDRAQKRSMGMGGLAE